MMRFVAATACVATGMNSFSIAAGETTPSLTIAPDHLWLWWGIGTIWLLNAVIIAFKGTEW